MDEYVKRDDTGIAVVCGNRSGLERRDHKAAEANHEIIPEVELEPISRRKMTDRRKDVELTHKMLVFEKAGPVTLGIVIVFLGLFFTLTGLTFLPIGGLYIGLFCIIAGAVMVISALFKEINH